MTSLSLLAGRTVVLQFSPFSIGHQSDHIVNIWSSSIDKPRYWSDFEFIHMVIYGKTCHTPLKFSAVYTEYAFIWTKPLHIQVLTNCVNLIIQNYWFFTHFFILHPENRLKTSLIASFFQHSIFENPKYMLKRWIRKKCFNICRI